MRWLIRLAKALGILVVVLLMLVAAAVVVSYTSWFRERIRIVAENQAARFLNGTLSLGAIEGNLVTGTVLKNVRITQDGQEVVAVDEVRLNYKSWELVRNDLLFRDLTVTRPRVRLIHDGTRWRIASLLRLPERRGGPGRALRMPGMVVREGTVSIERATNEGAVRWPARIRGLNGELSLTFAAGVTDLDIDRATFQAEDPALAVSSVSGRWTTSQGRHYVQDLHLRTPRSALDGSFSYIPAAPGDRGTMVSNLSLAPLDFEEFSGVVPGLAGRPLTVSGDGERVGTDESPARGHDALGSARGQRARQRAGGRQRSHPHVPRQRGHRAPGPGRAAGEPRRGEPPDRGRHHRPGARRSGLRLRIV